MDTFRLDGDFPTATREEWLKSVEAVLKGADFNKILVAKTYDDIAIQPLYERVKNTMPEGRQAGATPWRIDQRIDLTDLSTANAQVIEDHYGGATGFVITTSAAADARGFGVSLRDSEDLAALLKDVPSQEFNLRIEAGDEALRIGGLVLELVQQKKLPSAHLALDIGFDPVGTVARKGALAQPIDQAIKAGADTLHALREAQLKARLFLADGRPYHEAGASEAQELAAVISTALDYMRRLTALGVSLEEARESIAFLLVADADEFLTIAKFRALRQLWRQVEEHCGLEPKPLFLHAETAWRMMTRYDPWTNLLRCTTAVFSAGVAGADAVSVLPFTCALGLSDANARRIARNIQLVLINEANLWRVVDPAAGAGGFEALTQELCQKAWAAFQEIERENGILASLESGSLQARIAAKAEQRQKDLAVKKLKLTGISEFPDIHGEPVSVLAPFAEAASNAKLTAKALPSLRDAAAFELLRDRVEKRATTSGKRDAIFIAALGSQAAYTGRATFARNFFEVAGLEAVMPDGPLTPDNLAAAFAKSGAKIACIASSDDLYAEQAAAIAKAFETTGCHRVYLVCSKGLVPEWNIGSNVEAVTPRSNALAVLGQAVETAVSAA